MKKYILGFLAMCAFAFAPLAVVQADAGDMMNGASFEEMNEMMEEMMEGRLSPDRQRQFYGMMGQNGYRNAMGPGMMLGSYKGAYSYDALYWAHKIMYLLFSLLVLILLFLLNVVLYQKATGMKRKK